MQVRILGPVTVEQDGTSQVPDVPKVRALLAVLARRVGTPVSVDELVAALWGDEPPATASKTLQGHVSTVRRQLGQSAVATVPGGYMLDLPPGDVDAHRFEDQLRTAGAVAGEDPGRARELYAGALRLWRGEPLLDLADGAVRQGMSARLHELRYTALEGRIDADLALGHHADVIPELRQAVHEAPLREHLWADLMLALYRSDRQAEALAAYHELADLLREELGLDPSPRLQDLECRILLHDAGLEAAPPPPPHNLPSPLTSFVDRDGDVAQLEELLGRHRLVTLVGPGGVGKSRLAVEVAQRLLPSLPDGARWVDLSGVTSTDSILAQVAGALELTPAAGVEQGAAITSYLRNRSVLLVLDNCEHLVDAVAEVIGLLVAAGPDVSVLATSRVALSLEGERRWQVAPLDLEGHGTGPATSDAVRLFVDRAGDRGTPVDSPDDIGAATEICSAVDGLPLAIELAAAQTSLRSPVELRAELADPARLLGLGAHEGDERHPSLGATFAYSYRLLDDDARRMLTRLAVFPGDFDLTAATSVGCPGSEPAAAARVFASLVDASLVEARTGRDGGRRFRLLVVLRAFASARLDERGERHDAERDHARHYQQLAVAAGPVIEGPEGPRWLEAVRREDHNLRAAVDWFLAQGAGTDALRFAAALGHAWYVRGDLAGCRSLLGAMLDQGAEAPADLRAVAWLRLVWPRVLGGDPSGAAEASRQAVESFERTGNDLWLARAVRGQAHVILLTTGDTERALPLYRRAIGLYEAVGADGERAWAQITMAQALLLADRDEPSIDALLDEAEAALVAAHDSLGLAHLAMDRTFVAYTRDDTDALERAAGAQVGHSRAVNDTAYEQIALVALGLAAAEYREDPVRSHRLLRRAVALAWDTGNLLQLGVALQAVAATTSEDDRVRAARLWGAAETLSPVWPLFGRRYGELMRPARDGLGTGFDAAVDEGRGLSPEQAIELASEALAT